MIPLIEKLESSLLLTLSRLSVHRRSVGEPNYSTLDLAPLGPLESMPLKLFSRFERHETGGQFAEDNNYRDVGMRLRVDKKFNERSIPVESDHRLASF